jgi:tRNA pseudouridine55 synthase
MRGVLNVNKPSGLSSYDVIRHIKRLLSAQSAIPLGHAGTLDPLASGVLLVLVGEATKVSRLLLNLPKEYVASVLFGRQTDTDDITGKTLRQGPVSELTTQRVRAGLEEFRGEIEQVPPAFSALKQDGQPLYRLARRGLEVRPQPRLVAVYELELLDWRPPNATVRCRVSAGTYVRALARDLGSALGTVATLATLVRTKVGRFTIEDAVALSALDAATLIDRLVPIEVALAGMPRITVSPVQALHLLQGKVVSRSADPAAAGADGLALALTDDHRFLAIVVSKGANLRTERIIYAN